MGIKVVPIRMSVREKPVRYRRVDTLLGSRGWNPFSPPSACTSSAAPENARHTVEPLLRASSSQTVQARDSAKVGNHFVLNEVLSLRRKPNWNRFLIRHGQSPFKGWINYFLCFHPGLMLFIGVSIRTPWGNLCLRLAKSPFLPKSFEFYRPTIFSYKLVAETITYFSAKNNLAVKLFPE